MTDRLFVHYHRDTIGRLTRSPSGTITFAYDGRWRDTGHAFPISVSLPLDGSFDATAGHHFFVNLLPEAGVRQRICSALRISSDNDFELLKAIGGDCAGALAITPSEVPEASEAEPRYEPVTDEQLAAWSVGTPDAFSAVTGQNEVRLSLAGAQDKLPVRADGDRTLIPIGSTPSTHLLKFASPYYSHLPENETFVTMLARGIGLPVVDISLRKTRRAAIALIRRYDRMEVDGRYRRLHQEDFCQALGISPARKYQKEGGPGVKQCADVIRRHTSFPLIELQKLLRWLLFNLLVGNADAHGKNLSLLYEDRRRLTLAPFYDLVCTRNYKSISRHLAMSIGDNSDPDLITESNLAGLADDVGVRPDVVTRTLSTLADELTTVLPTTADQFREQFGDSPVLERIPLIIRKQIRRLT